MTIKGSKWNPKTRKFEVTKSSRKGTGYRFAEDDADTEMIEQEDLTPKKKKRNLSKAARARISQAQKALWAKVKNEMKFEFNQDKREWKDVTPGKAIGEKVSAAFAKLIPEMSGKTVLQDKVNHPVHYGRCTS